MNIIPGARLKVGSAKALKSAPSYANFFFIHHIYHMVHVLYVICFCKAALFIYNVTGSLYVASLLFKCIILHVFVSTVSRY